MAIKITSGKKKGISLLVPKSAKELRPSQSKLREALINILQNGSFFPDGINGLRVLDLYSGVGTVGFELLSNGAAHVCFIEKDKHCLRSLRENIRNLGFYDSCRVMGRTVREGLQELSSKIAREHMAFDLVFADPPYKNYRDFETVLGAISEGGILQAGGLVVWEVPTRLDEEKLAEIGFSRGLELIKNKSYGDSSLIFLRKT